MWSWKCNSGKNRQRNEKFFFIWKRKFISYKGSLDCIKVKITPYQKYLISFQIPSCNKPISLKTNTHWMDIIERFLCYPEYLQTCLNNSEFAHLQNLNKARFIYIDWGKISQHRELSKLKILNVDLI